MVAPRAIKLKRRIVQKHLQNNHILSGPPPPAKISESAPEFMHSFSILFLILMLCNYCITVCSIADAPIVVNTTRTPSTGGALVPGSSITYGCNNALESIAPNTVVCQQDGTWTPSSLGSCQQTGMAKNFWLWYLLHWTCFHVSLMAKSLEFLRENFLINNMTYEHQKA